MFCALLRPLDKLSPFLNLEYSDSIFIIGGFMMQVYLSLYTTVESMVNQITSGATVSGDSLSICGFKVWFTLNLYSSFFLIYNLSLNRFLRSAVYLPLVISSISHIRSYVVPWQTLHGHFNIDIKHQLCLRRCGLCLGILKIYLRFFLQIKSILFLHCFKHLQEGKHWENRKTV